MWELTKSNFWVQISIVLTLAGFFNYALRIPSLPNKVPILFDIDDSGNKFENLKYFTFFLFAYLYFLWQVARSQFEKASLLVGLFNLVWIGIISFLCSLRFLQVLKNCELKFIPDWAIWLTIPYCVILLILGLPILRKKFFKRL